MSNDIGPHVKPEWWNSVRQIIIFLLGIGTVLYAIVTPGHDASFLVTGLILIGLVSIEDFANRRLNGTGKHGSHTS